MKLLFVKHSLAWPRSSGHDVHTFHMMKACGELGHEIFLATVVPPEPQAVEGAAIREYVRLSAPLGSNVRPLDGTRMQHKFRSYWGVEDHWVLSLRDAVERLRPEAVVVGGLDALPFLPSLRNTIRVWYAADEWVLHHASQLQFSVGSWREHAKAAAVKGLYERVHRNAVDRAWVVTEADRRAMQRIAGIHHADLLPNGVDATFFAPGREVPRDRTAAFWGRLDFGPNIQALEWFGRRVWPLVRRRVPDAEFTVIGFQPVDAVRGLIAEQPGMTLQANLRDLRSTARSHALAVMPFVSGAGIKNKLLEAAAMGIPIVGTQVAAQGLRGKPPMEVGTTPEQLADAMAQVWADEALRRRLSTEGRAWVIEQHAWKRSAEDAIAALERHKRNNGTR